MTERAQRALLALFALTLGCATARHAPVQAETRVAEDLRVVRGFPPIAVVVRDGDPRGAVAAAVMTAEIAPERGAEAAVALAAIVEARLLGHLDAIVVPGWDGYRVKALVEDGGRAADAIRTAMLAPVTDAETERAKKKLAALSARPMRDAALLDSVRCTGEAFGMAPRGDGRSAEGATSKLTTAEIETWRRAAHGTGRVALAVAGPAPLADDVSRGLVRAGVWPNVRAAPQGALPAADAPAAVYDATGDVPAGGARATIAIHMPHAARALAAAAVIGDSRGPLSSRLGALDAPARVQSVTATAHAHGGCLAVTLDIAPRDLAEAASTSGPTSGYAAARIATAIALARQEISVEVSETTAELSAARQNARRASDPREAAERAAWWALAGDSASKEAASGIRMSTAIGVAFGRDTLVQDAPNAMHAAIRSALDRATIAWHEPVVEARTRVERGQGEMWLLLGSPCGTLAEAENDAGLGAAATLATARETDLSSLRWSLEAVKLEPYVTPDAIGLIAHAPALFGESPTAHARRVADAAARAFAADWVDPPRASTARAHLLRASENDDGRAWSALASAFAPGHPSWFWPFGMADALGRASDASVLSRVSALRAGPLRVAVLANADSAQADTAIRATDRWVARHPSETRACPAPATGTPSRPGTYPVESTAGATEAHLGFALPAADDAARAAASWTALALDGPDGLLAKALGNGLARSWSARVSGGSRAPALVVRIATAPGALDAAVAQTRALFDRVRQGALTDADLLRAKALRSAADVSAALDPRARLVGLFRGDSPLSTPTLDALRAFASAVLLDDALVIVAVRPRTTAPGSRTP